MKEDVLETLRRLGQGLAETAQNRLKLIQSELGDEIERLGALLARQLLIALTALLTVQWLGVLVMAWCWDTPYRVHVAASLAALAAIVTALAYRAYTARKQRTRAMFESSLEELQKDRQALEKAL